MGTRRPNPLYNYLLQSTPGGRNTQQHHIKQQDVTIFETLQQHVSCNGEVHNDISNCINTYRLLKWVLK